MQGYLAVVTGPSGVGKGTLIREVCRRGLEMHLPVSATTRLKKGGEVDGREYHFRTPEQFQELVDEGAFIEQFEYAGNRYGTLRSEVEGPLSQGQLVLLEIEVQGALRVREVYPDAVLIFINAPLYIIEQRLPSRGRESEQEVQLRLKTAKWERSQKQNFDFLLVNDDLASSVEALYELLAERARPWAVSSG